MAGHARIIPTEAWNVKAHTWMVHAQEPGPITRPKARSIEADLNEDSPCGADQVNSKPSRGQNNDAREQTD